MVLRVVVPLASAEAVSDQLWAAGASAVAEAVIDGDRVRLTTDLDACPPSLSQYEHDVFDDDGSWRDGWRPYARAALVGPFEVRPPWLTATSSLRPLLVDAGHAFGTGSHPSTTLALEVIASHVADGGCRSVLDVGCGSGVLCIGAALLGASPVVAIDVDEAALEATLTNAVLNGVGGAISVSATPLPDVEGRFDLVAANLGSPLVVELATAISAKAAGVLVLSGLLDDRWSHVPPAYPDFDVVDTPTRDGWRAIVLSRR